MEELRRLIRDIPDFPKPGIVFRDVMPLIEDAAGLHAAVQALTEPFRGQAIDRVLGIESRGFLFGVPVALELGVGFVAARKEGKLPHTTLSADYELEYGSDRLEVHTDSIGAGHRVLVVDDLLATGGTAGAALELVRSAGGEVAGCAFLIELRALSGRAALGDVRVESLIRYD